MARLFPALCRFPDRMAVRFGSSGLTYGELAAAATDLSCRIAGARRVAVWATSSPQTVVGVVAALLAGVPAVPLNPKSGEKELGHILADSAPTYLLAAPSVELPGVLKDLSRIDIALGGAPAAAVTEPEDDEAAALIVYTSGTTGPPKGAVLPRRAVAATLDGLAEVWQWTADDVLVHGLPLFHVHGLVLGVLGPLRRGGTVRHLGRFTTEGVADELSSGATMLFGVPTMYHRIAEVLPADPQLAKALTGARLLVSGSAALPLHDHERITAVTGRRVIERYGMTETLMSTSVHPDAPSAPGTVGHHLPGVEVRLVDDSRHRTRRRRPGPCRRDPGPRSQPLHGVPQPTGRHRGGIHRRGLVPHRRHGGPRQRRIDPDRRPPGYRPDQERRLQDRRGGDRERAPGTSGRTGSRGDR